GELKLKWCLKDERARMTSSSFFFFSSRRRHTRSDRDWSSDVCSSDLPVFRSRPRLREGVAPTAAPGALVLPRGDAGGDRLTHPADRSWIGNPARVLDLAREVGIGGASPHRPVRDRKSVV